MKKVSIHTLGCKLNFSESSTIGRQFRQHGFEDVPFPQKADVYVINTCSVTDNADKKCKKAVKRALKTNPEGYVIVMGCYAQLKPTEISEIPGVDVVLGAKEKFSLFNLIDSFDKEHSCKVLASEIKDTTEFVDGYSVGNRTRSFLKIQDGCDYKCTFCTIPLARGKSRSDELQNILQNARKIGQNGTKEIVLTGVNIGDFKSKSGEKFIDVIKELDNIESIDRFRISSIEPNLLSDEIIEFVAKSKRFMPHFHIPLQSGNDELLAKMKRRYRSDLYRSRIEKIRETMPQACIGVDVIVGFPGETDEIFESTYLFLNELEVSYLHVFTYSERPNTPAISMDNKIPLNIRFERNLRLRNLSEMKKRAFYAGFEGKEMEVLFEKEKKDGAMYGFTQNYIKVKAPFSEEMVNSLEKVSLGQIDEEGIVIALPLILQ